jgi:hypothetical protein
LLEARFEFMLGVGRRSSPYRVVAQRRRSITPTG